MSDRMIQINEMLRSEIAIALSEEVYLDNGLITVTRVNCSNDLKAATVVVSVLPENISGTALSLLRKNSKLVSKKLGRLNLKNIPKLRWKIDSQERFAAQVEKAIDDIK